MDIWTVGCIHKDNHSFIIKSCFTLTRQFVTPPLEGETARHTDTLNLYLYDLKN